MKPLSPNEAGRIAGVSGQTIRNLVKEGKITASRDDKGRMQIDPAELGRVYPEQVAKHLQVEVQVSQNGASIGANEVETLRREVAQLRERLRQADEREVWLRDLVDRLALPAGAHQSAPERPGDHESVAAKPEPVVEHDAAESDSEPSLATPEQTDQLRPGLLSRLLNLLK